MSGSDNYLIITTEFPPGPGGIGNHAYNLAKFLKLNEINVTVLAVSDFVSEDEKKEFDRKQDFKIIRFERYNSKLRTYRERISLIRKKVREENYSNIIFSGMSSLMSLLLLRRLKSNSNFISIAHGGEINAKSFFEKTIVNRALKNSDLIIPVSRYSGTKIDGNIDRKKMHVIPNGFDLDMSEVIQLKAKVRKEINGAVRLVSVGSIWPRKGHHNVLNALPEIISDHPGTTYDIVGRESDTSLCRKYFNDEKLKDSIKIHGQISNENMYAVLNSSDIFILLSETQPGGDFEGFGIAVIEANYFGLPSIGSLDSGMEDSVKDGESGILVNPRDKNQIRKAVNDICNNYGHFSEGAKKWAEEHHWSVIVKRYIDVINRIK
ncbi:MAG TPA: glycosyltransferase family 4 protein [Ignavibacteria bacterium]|nr:glycosyltransferase family 4 protein [Ignavibacteria bacterium]